jgi:hypothetical protein
MPVNPLANDIRTSRQGGDLRRHSLHMIERKDRGCRVGLYSASL